MTNAITLSPETITRLKVHAEPLVDTFDSVINKAIDALEKMLAADGAPLVTPSPDQNQVAFNPHSPPNLSYTTVKSVVFAGKRLPPAKTYWNTLKEEVIREAAKTISHKALFDIISCNKVEGCKEDGGYKFIAEANLSIQGQDANGAWATTYLLIEAMKAPIQVVFEWQDNPKAAAPGKKAIISLPI